MVRRQVLSLTTDSGGAASGTISLNGFLHSIRLAGFDGSADIVVSAPGIAILTKTAIDADEVFYPRAPVHAVADGAAITGGYGEVLLSNDTVTVTIANGGNAVAGSVTFVMHD